MKPKILNDWEYCIRLVPLPGDVNACVRLSPDGFANVYVNVNLAPEARRKAAEHELRHIARNDFYNGKTISEVESDA